jgi:hypothetical protein
MDKKFPLLENLNLKQEVDNLNQEYDEFNKQILDFNFSLSESDKGKEKKPSNNLNL